MSASSDISSLFKRFGGRADQYKEFTQEEPRQAPAVQRPQLVREEPELLVSDLAIEPSVNVETPSVWSAAGLQQLLNNLARASADAELASDTAELGKPSLGHIRIVAVVSAKGGVGKTTLAANLAVALHQAGRPVVALDLDPQDALHQHFQLESISCGLAATESAAAMESTSGVAVLPYGVVDETRRQAFEAELAQDPEWLAHRLQALNLEEGALVVLDTPPGPSVYLQQALSVANLALVVSLADAASYTALPKIEALIQTYAAERENFAGTGYLINQVDNSRQLNRDICRILHDLLGAQLLGIVHSDPLIAEALAYNRHVLEFDPHGHGCRDILGCASALVTRLASDTRVELAV